ncbi:MAG TPA: heme exporter protein CcmB [Candidatus Binatia bacterium]|nr:heme exporter protein CcmB [Candidatus Binatia bacterium]
MWLILRKDLRIEFRSKTGLVSLFVLGLLVLLILQFAMPEKPTPESAAAGLWISFVFAGTLGAQRTFLLERENLCIEGLKTAPLDPASIFIAKMLGTATTLALLQGVVVPLTTVFFGIAPQAPVALVGVCALGNLGFSALATLFASISVASRAREVLLPLLIFPVLVPLVIAAVKASSVFLGGGAPGEAAVWVRVLVAFDVVFAVAGWLLFEQVLRD